MSIDFELHDARVSDKPVLQNLLQLYQYDWSEFGDEDLDEHGLFDYSHLDHYWTEPERHAYLIRVQGRLAGFAMVNKVGRVTDGAFTIAEFFVLRRYRRKGLGRTVAYGLFDRFPGNWEVRQLAINSGAVAFWRTVVSDYTKGSFEEHHDVKGWDGPVQTFRVG